MHYLLLQIGIDLQDPFAKSCSVQEIINRESNGSAAETKI